MPAALCNVPKDGSAPAFELASHGVQIIRIVPDLRYDVRAYLDEVRDAGMRVLFVNDMDVLGADPAHWEENWESVHTRYRGRYHYAQHANEADQPGSPSSWHLTPAMYSLMLRTLRPRTSVPLIMAGLVSGDPNWLARLDPGTLKLVDALAVHPYGQRPTPDWPTPSWGFGVMGELCGRYQGISVSLGGPDALWVTEVGFSSVPRATLPRRLLDLRDTPRGRNHAHPDVLHPAGPQRAGRAGPLTTSQAEQFQADYCERSMAALRVMAGLVAGGWFAWHNFEGFGLVRDDGDPKPALDAYHRATVGFTAPGGPELPPAPEPPQEAAQYKLGFLDFFNAAPRLLGAPKENEGSGIDGLSFQDTERCLLTAARVDGEWVIAAYEKATRAVWRYRNGAVERTR